jgi:hypothetical protein
MLGARSVASFVLDEFIANYPNPVKRKDGPHFTVPLALCNHNDFCFLSAIVLLAVSEWVLSSVASLTLTDVSEGWPNVVLRVIRDALAVLHRPMELSPQLLRCKALLIQQAKDANRRAKVQPSLARILYLKRQRARRLKSKLGI